MADHEKIIDADGAPITIGTRIHFEALPAVEGRYPAQPECFAAVTAISDVDGDVDDEGRSIAIYPKVTVRFDDGRTEDFGTHWAGRWHDDDAPFQADDLRVAEGE